MNVPIKAAGALDEARALALLLPYLDGIPPSAEQFAKFQLYLDLILRWNARTNLTAVREPEAILQRQIGESLVAAKCMPYAGSVLDFGSGAGLPGIPIAIMRPGLQVTLAESQGKKASFLREAARTLQVPLTIWANRVEALPPKHTFDMVTMRAVDDTQRMLRPAMDRVAVNGKLFRYLGESTPVEIPGWSAIQRVPIPNSSGMLQILTRD